MKYLEPSMASFYYACIMHNQPHTVNHLKNYHGFDKNLY